jgi:mono/diheme cytochrome c family protein
MRTFAVLLLVFAGVTRAEPELTITANGQKTVLTRSQLLKHPALETLTLSNVPTFQGKTVKMKAIRTAKLFEGIRVNADGAIQFFCQDGFSAPILQARLLTQAPDQSTSYVAIEAKNEWPKIKKGKESAGPFFLVWVHPEKSSISGMEWPYQLVAFEVKNSLKEVFPEIFPDDRLNGDSAEMKGFAVFMKNCFACHTINRKGTSEVGPDLNVPMNPTEYLQPQALAKLIRNPQEIRHWPQGRMSGFAPEVLSDAELKSVIQYLKHMSHRKIAPPKN